MNRLPVFLLLLIIGFLVISVAKYLYARCQNLIIAKVNLNVKMKLFHKFINENEANNEGQSATQLSLLTNDMKLFEQNYLKIIFNMVFNFCVFLFSIIMAFLYDVRMAAIFVLFSLIPIFIPKIFSGKIKQKSSEWSGNNSNYIAILKDHFNGIETIKSYGIEKLIFLKTKKTNADLENSMQKMNNTVELSNTVVLFFGMICFFIPIIIGSYFTINGELTLAALMGLLQINNTIINPLLTIISDYNTIITTKPIIHRINNILKEQREKERNGNLQNIEFHSITLNQVFVKGRDKNILENISLNIKKGEKVLIMGTSGSGKSTLLKVLRKRLPVYQGEIYLDSLNYQDIDNEAVMQNFSLIGQKPFLFDESIEYNITLGEDFTKEEILHACEKSGLAEMVTEKGLDYQVGEDGKNLSGGQQQRIEIARAIIRKRDILLIDEATASLDAATALNIRKTFLAMPQTIVEVAHHIERNLLPLYDKIIVITDGKIIENDSFAELSKHKNSFINQMLPANM
ncbi:ABC transporter ATP-binding protein [Bacillaceae bacterium Marseille-Q3522]|nr:ABC transporter ATP-binding protein [Bacillaceae bacterium Marseille-Q3522]